MLQAFENVGLDRKLHVVAAVLVATRLINRLGVSRSRPRHGRGCGSRPVRISEARPVDGLRPLSMRRGLFSATEVKADGNGHYFAKADINGTTIAVMVDTGAIGCRAFL